jgi:hypothetical protein
MATTAEKAHGSHLLTFLFLGLELSLGTIALALLAESNLAKHSKSFSVTVCLLAW